MGNLPTLPDPSRPASMTNRDRLAAQRGDCLRCENQEPSDPDAVFKHQAGVSPQDRRTPDLVAIQHPSPALRAPASSRPYPMAKPGYGKRSMPDQLPRSADDFALLPVRERYVAGYIDHLPDGASMDVKSLAKQLPLYGQQAVGSALKALAAAGYLRRVRCLVGELGQVRWVSRTFWSRTARDNEWWAATEVTTTVLAPPVAAAPAPEPVAAPSPARVPTEPAQVPTEDPATTAPAPTRADSPVPTGSAPAVPQQRPPAPARVPTPAPAPAPAGHSPPTSPSRTSAASTPAWPCRRPTVRSWSPSPPRGSYAAWTRATSRRPSPPGSPPRSTPRRARTPPPHRQDPAARPHHPGAARTGRPRPPRDAGVHQVRHPGPPGGPPRRPLPPVPRAFAGRDARGACGSAQRGGRTHVHRRAADLAQVPLTRGVLRGVRRGVSPPAGPASGRGGPWRPGRAPSSRTRRTSRRSSRPPRSRS